MRTTLSGLLLLTLATISGCATDGADSAGPGGSGGGKADGSTDGLHVRTVTTQLGVDNAIKWPEVVDTASDVDDKINAQITFETITGENLEETKRLWADGEAFHQGVDSAEFEVNANLRNVLSMSIHYETLYAYPDMQDAYVNFNSNTGAAIGIKDLLTEASLPVIASKLDVVLQARIKQLKTELAAEIASGEVEATQWDELHVTAADLESFSTTPDGITFHYDPGFPHVIVALEPDGEFKVPFEQLEPAISGTGLWADEY
jgi:hypothetical protein